LTCESAGEDLVVNKVDTSTKSSRLPSPKK
jgi:hypothetical protein